MAVKIMVEMPIFASVNGKTFDIAVMRASVDGVRHADGGIELTAKITNKDIARALRRTAKELEQTEDAT